MRHTLNSHLSELYKTLPVLLRAANEQVLGQNVLETRCAPSSQGQDAPRDGLKRGKPETRPGGWVSFGEGPRGRRDLRPENPCSSHHLLPITSQGAINCLKIRAGVQRGSLVEFGVTVSNASCQDTGESSSQPSGIIAMVAIKPRCLHTKDS